MTTPEFQFENPAAKAFEVVDFFERVDRKNGGDGLVWCKATAPGGMQVIIEIKDRNNSKKPVWGGAIVPGDPMCLSQKCPDLELIKQSSTIAQSAAAGIVKLMTTADVTAWYTKKAKTMKTSPQELMKKAQAEQALRDQKKALPEDQVRLAQHVPGDLSDTVMVDDIINPRLHHLAAQVSPQLPDAKKMSAKELMGEVLNMEDILSFDDLMYVQSHFYYPTIRNWATKKIGALNADAAPDSDELS